MRLIASTFDVREHREEYTTSQGDNCKQVKGSRPIFIQEPLISLLHRFTKDTNLIRPVMTCFATSYLTLGCWNENKTSLVNMFTSNDGSLLNAKSKDGILVENVIMDKVFWKNVLNYMKSVFPPIRML